jgi:serine/threonine protein kinase
MSTPPKLNNDEAELTPRLPKSERPSPPVLNNETRHESTRRSITSADPSVGRSGLHPDMWDEAIKQQKGLTSFNPDMIPDSEPLDSSNDSFIGTIFVNKYQVTELLGRGGMGAVYKAVHTVTGKAMAIKMMHAHLVTDFHIFRRFQQEATAASRLNHPNAINIHDLGMSEDGRPYLIMDYLEGKALSALIKRDGGFPVDVCLHIFSQACAALAEAHSHGVVHRDVKPSNIMILRTSNDAYFVKVVDFGIAKVFPQEGDPTVKDTTTGELFGSPPYMSPEQCLGKKLDARSDIYSMGCLMYEALTGEPPLVGSNALGTMYRQINEMPKPLSEIDGDVRLTQRLDEIILKSMQKNPDQRYQSISELKKDIDSASDLAQKKFAVFAQVGLLFSGAYRTWVNKLGSSKKLVVGLIVSLSLLLAFIVYGVMPILAIHDPEDRSVDWSPVVSETAKDEDRVRKQESIFNLKRNMTPYNSVERVEISRRIADFYLEAQKYDSALLNYKAAKETAHGLDPGAVSVSEMSAVFAGAAECYWQQRKAQTAFEAAKTAFNLLNGANLGGSLAGLKAASLAAQAGDAVGDRSTEPYFNLVLSFYPIVAKKEGRADDLAPILSFLADHDFKHGAQSEAERLYGEARDKWKALGDRGLFNVAAAHNKLGLAFMKDNNYGDAAAEFNQAASIFSDLGGKDDSSRAIALFNLSDAYWKQHKLIDSLQTQFEARRVWKLHQERAIAKKNQP